MGSVIVHPIPPVFDENSRILILGSFPSVRSREAHFFYGHPQNRFWRVLSSVLGERTPGTVEEKKSLLLRNGIALWDVLGSCEIEGSSDASIKNAVPNDLSVILGSANIGAIFTNGGAAYKYYKKFAFPATGRDAIPLPSTSPANAAWSTEKLTREWEKIIRGLR